MSQKQTLSFQAEVAQLRKLLAAGAKAPSTRNKQSWEFIWVTDPQRVAQIAELKYQYRLGYDPPQGPARFRRVEVRTTRRGVAVRTRNGYVPRL